MRKQTIFTIILVAVSITSIILTVYFKIKYDKLNGQNKDRRLSAINKINNLVLTRPPFYNNNSKDKSQYDQFDSILPGVKNSQGVYVWTPFSCDNTGKYASCVDASDPEQFFFDWVSTDTGGPILSGIKSTGKCLKEGSRPKLDFAHCCVTNINHENYTGTKYDRGHMVSSGDNELFHTEACKTFAACNIVPQSHANNAGDWQKLEYSSQYMGINKIIFILSGPMYDENPMCICNHKLGPQKCGSCDPSIKIPSAYFKIIIDTSNNGIKTWVFISDGSSINDWEGNGTAITQTVEQMFQKDPSAGLRRIESKSNLVFEDDLYDLQTTCPQELCQQYNSAPEFN